MTNKTIKMFLAISAAPSAIPPKPKTAAMSAIIKKCNNPTYHDINFKVNTLNINKHIELMLILIII